LQIRAFQVEGRVSIKSLQSETFMTTRSRTDMLLLAGFCAFLFFYGLGAFGLIGADEPRYAQVAREMLDRGDWITPVLGGRPWLEKPPLYYWQAMIAYSVFGVSDLAARIPSALDATLLVVAVYFFFRKFRSGGAIDAALIAASCAGIIGFARAASTDMPLAATFGLGMLAWWAWYESQKKIYLAAFFIFMALGMLAKGPVAPFLAGVVIVVFAAAAGELRVVVKTLWPPGVALFFLIALPWYLAAQMRNPQFFHEFIFEHNLARFSTNLYHHPEPLWYYVPVAALALVPWIVLGIAAIAESLRAWWNERNSPEIDHEIRLRIFACCWFFVPLVFFSLSRSKLPGYILPSVPAGALLLADFLHQHLTENRRVAKWLIVLHSMVAACTIVPAVLIGFIVTEHHLPAGRPLLFAVSTACVVGAALVLTLIDASRLRMLRFVTLVPVVLSVAAVLKLGSMAIDRQLSMRPLALELASVETHKLPIAVCGAPREVEYGLAFYRNQIVQRYESGDVPPGEHLLVAAPAWKSNIAVATAGRRVSFLGHYTLQDLDYYWVAAAK
jgi:4-amino-4-deoxy-L-arabinose transferase-like glycosyltransferase